MSSATFIENDEGVHVMDPTDPEYTLCGDAWDAPDTEKDWEAGEFRQTKRKTVTCKRCTRAILGLRGVRVALSRPHDGGAA